MAIGLIKFDRRKAVFEPQDASMKTSIIGPGPVFSVFKLNGCELADYAVERSDVLAVLPYFRLLYLNCHGATWPPGTNIHQDIPFQAIATEGGNITASDVSNVIPAHVSGGKYQYDLVFLNACSSEDYLTTSVYVAGNNTTYTSQANAMYQAFNTRAYMGWNQPVPIIKTGVAGPLFYNRFSGARSVSEVIDFVNDPANGVNSASRGDTAILQSLGDSSVTADNIAKNNGN